MSRPSGGGFELRIAPDDLRRRVAQLGEDVTEAYQGTEPVLVTVLNGGVPFLADLVRHIRVPLAVDFLALGRYPDGAPRIVKDLDVEVTGRHVLVVEDVVDTGLTLAYLVQLLAARSPASLRIATLLDRRVRRIAELPLDFVGFEVGDEFLAGYGLDLADALRELPGVVAVVDRDAARRGGAAEARRVLAAARRPGNG